MDKERQDEDISKATPVRRKIRLQGDKVREAQEQHRRILNRMTMTPRHIERMVSRDDVITRSKLKQSHAVRFVPMPKWPTFYGNEGEDPVQFLVHLEEVAEMEL